MSVDKNKSMDYVYGVKFTSEGMMLGDKRFDVDKDDNIIIDGIKYTGTEGIYDLIFKKFPNHKKYTQDDLYKYQSILKATNMRINVTTKLIILLKVLKDTSINI